jgi:hypothetical protein
MPANLAEIEFLADLPLYQTEKPYLCLLSPEQKIDPDQVRLDNLEFEKHSNIKVEDLREHPELRLDDCGFEYIQHETAISEFTNPADVDAYKRETESLLRDRFVAVRVLTYELRLRKNQEFRRKQFDLNEKLLLEGPAKGAHNGKRPEISQKLLLTTEDVTYDSGPKIIQRYLSIEDQNTFLKPGYRIRIVKLVQAAARHKRGLMAVQHLASAEPRA